MGREVWDIISTVLDSPRCPSCPGDCAVVPGDGPYGQVQCDYMFIGEAPGRDENEYGRPFIGRAGRSFNEIYLPLAGLTRGDIYLSNTRKCKPPNKRKPKDHEIATCSGHFLPYELEVVQPSIIVLMGGTAASLVKDKDNPIDLEVHHGRARQAELFGNTYTVFTTYHPALGLHDSTKIRLLRQDFIDLKRYMDTEGRWNGAVDEYAGREQYHLLGMGGDVDGDANGYLGYAMGRVESGEVDIIATDTESVNGRMWSWQVSVEPGKSIMGMCDDYDAMGAYLKLLNAVPNIVMHNAKHDMREMVDSGIVIPWAKVRDTMPIAYRLGESQGLKALAGRHCGMRMKSYMEVVKPYSREHVEEWIVGVLVELPGVEEEYVTKVKQERKVKMRKNPLTTPLMRIANSMNKNSEYDPWKAWAKVTADIETEANGEKVKGRKTHDEDKAKVMMEWRDWVVDRLGDMPTVGLDKVPMEVAKRYACRDSDANIRVYEVLDRMEREFGREVREGDWG